MEAQELIYQLETEMLENLVSLLKRGAIGSAEWQARTLQGLGFLQGLNAQAIKDSREKILNAINKELRARALARVAMVDKASAAAGVVLVPSLATQRILARWEASVAIKLETVYAQMLQAAGKRFVETVQVATAKTALGMSGRKAVAEIVTGWGKGGLDAFRDAAGRHWTPEAYAGTLVRSSSTQMATETQLARMEELGEDLVEISSHLGARPKCEPYQGKIFSLSGKSKRYPALSDTSYGQVDGLFGINCRHVMYPYFAGTGKTYSPYPKKENDKVYAESQEQRKLERAIRGAKRELKLAQGLGDEGEILKAKERVSAYQKKMRGFINYTGRRRDYDREQVRG